MNLKTFTFCLIPLIFGALNAMEQHQESQPLKKARVSIALLTFNSKNMAKKDLAISYTQDGKIVSPVYQKVSQGAYAAEILVNEQMKDNVIEILYDFFDDNVSVHDEKFRILLGEKPSTFIYYDGSKVLAQLIITATSQEDVRQ